MKELDWLLEVEVIACDYSPLPAEHLQSHPSSLPSTIPLLWISE